MPDVSSLDGRLLIRLEVLPGASPLERFEFAQRAGFDGIAFPGRHRDTFERPVRELVAQGSPLPVRSVSLGFDASLCSPDLHQRRRCRDSLRRLLDLCSDLGAGILNLPPALIQDNPVRFPINAVAEQDALLREQLPELGDAARERGILLLLEPVNRYESGYLHTLSHAGRLCAEIAHPAVGFTADLFHMQLEELNSAAALTTASKWLRHVHVAENTRVEPGPGQLDFEGPFRALQDAGYSGFVEVECRALSGPAEELLPASAHFLRQTWNRVCSA